MDALGSFISAGVGTAMDAVKLNNQISMNESARDYDYNKWREYVYEIDPKTQVKKLRAAGINPAVALSQGAIDSGNPSSQAPDAKIPDLDFSSTAQGFRDSAALFQQSMLQKSQRENLDASTENQLIRNKTQLMRDFQDLFKMYSETDKNSKEGQLLWQRIQIAAKELDAFDAQNAADIDLKKSQSKEHEAHAAYLQAETDYQNIVNRFEPNQRAILLRNLDKQGAAIDAAASRDNAAAAESAARKAVEEARKEGLDIDNELAEEVMDARIDKAFREADETYWKSENQRKGYHLGIGSKLPTIRNGRGEASDIMIPQRPPSSRSYRSGRYSRKK